MNVCYECEERLKQLELVWVLITQEMNAITKKKKKKRQVVKAKVKKVVKKERKKKGRRK